MTHEQKPETAEFRTREELEALASSYINRHYLPDCWHDVGAMVAEMMAAGAAEQRRKDAEGAEPVAWLISDRLKGKPGCAHIVDRTTTNRTYAEYQATLGFDVTPLCSKGANVAVLEARVKELEEEVERLKKTEWYINQNEEAAAFDIATIMEGADPWEIKEVEGCRIVEKAWAYVDDYGHIHKFPTKAAAKSAAEAICAWAESLKKR